MYTGDGGGCLLVAQSRASALLVVVSAIEENYTQDDRLAEGSRILKFHSSILRYSVTLR